MANIEILKRSNQADGNFNNGEIIEKKPIGFPQDGGMSKPYSNIFYWAHAWTTKGKSTIGLHPHQGFEICSFVLKGEISHYDTKQDKWIKLQRGDVQIIRAGNGISHAEELLENSEIFQIWFDPDLSKSMSKDASYDDYKDEDFNIEKNTFYSVKTIVGPGSKMSMDSEGVEIYEFEINKSGNIEIENMEKFIFSFFLISGKIQIENNIIEKGDFFKIHSKTRSKIEVISPGNLFMIKSPIKANYVTYAEKRFV